MDHLKSLKTVNFVLGAYTVVLGLIFFVVWVIPGLWAWWEGDDEGLIAVGSGRGRVAQTFLAAMQIMSFPLGTVYAVYALWVCWVNEPSAKRFASDYKPPVS